MNTDNRTNEPTPEQVEAAMLQLFPITVRYDGCDVPNPGAADKREGFKAGIEYMRGLLSEGAPSEAQVEAAAKAMQNESGGFFSLESWRHLARAALAAAGVASQEPKCEHGIALIDLCQFADQVANDESDPQEPSRLPDFFAPKPMPNSYVPAPVLPSSICQHNMVSYTDSVSEKPENFCSLCGYQPSSGVDVETLANLIHSTSVAHFGGLDPRVAPIIARAVAEWLKGQGR